MIIIIILWLVWFDCVVFPRFGIAGCSNVQAEVMRRLDIVANDLFINMMKSSFGTCLLISEENEEAIEVEADKQVQLNFQHSSFFKFIFACRCKKIILNYFVKRIMIKMVEMNQWLLYVVVF